jgi:transposase
MQNGHRIFTKEFKVEAVKLVQTSGKSATQVAHDLGIADSNVHRWCLQFGDHGGDAFPGSGHQLPQEEEYRRLQRELEVVKQERDILKKAIAIFSHPQS